MAETKSFASSVKYGKCECFDFDELVQNISKYFFGITFEYVFAKGLQNVLTSVVNHIASA